MLKNKWKQKKEKRNKVKSSIKNILIVDFSRTLGRLTVKIILWFLCISLNRRNHVIRPKSELSRCLYIVLILWFLMSQVKTIKSCYFRTQTLLASKNIFKALIAIIKPMKLMFQMVEKRHIYLWMNLWKNEYLAGIKYEFRFTSTFDF